MTQKVSMEQKDYVKLSFYMILGGMALHIVLNPKDILWEDMFVAFGTVLLALFTYTLASGETASSAEMRELMINEARMERRRLRIKEQLEGLYSPLMAELESMTNQGSHYRPDAQLFLLMSQLKSKYEYLADSDLKEQLRDYYNTNLSEVSPERWENMVDVLRDAIAFGHLSLIEEYDALTKPIE